MKNLGWSTELDYRECLAACGLSLNEYDVLIQTLFQATADDPAAHSAERLDSFGVPLTIASLTRALDHDYSITLEDRGLTYIVWIHKMDVCGGTREVIWRDEFLWEAILEYS
ncbi:MAG: hypothetical protein P4L50_08865 [Anaerolineaceae bacterium]|nr:hypothetical protein [Anaerolineaceae bacterium]